MVAKVWVGLGLTVVLLGLAGCGSESSEAPEAEPTSAASSTSGEPDESESTPVQPEEETPEDGGGEALSGCPYLTAEQVTEALGSPTTETAGTMNACFFDPEAGEGPSVALSRIDIQIDPADYASQSRELCEGDVTDVEAPGADTAFACVGIMGPEGQFYSGRALVTISVSDAADDAAGVAAAAALLPLVMIPAG